MRSQVSQVQHTKNALFSHNLCSFNQKPLKKGKKMEKTINNRSIIKEKMSQVFGENLAAFPKSVRNDFLDDMVTAFESREAMWQKTLNQSHN